MKRIFVILSIILLASACSKEEYRPNDDLYDSPDEIFAEFCLANYDLDGDGELSTDEAFEVRSMDCSSLGISSLYGILRFRNLEALICDNNNLRVLDISGLENLKYLSCKGNQIEELDLRDSSLEYVYCSPMNDSSGHNVLQFVYVYFDQDFLELDVPEDTYVIALPRP